MPVDAGVGDFSFDVVDVVFGYHHRAVVGSGCAKANIIEDKAVNVAHEEPPGRQFTEHFFSSIEPVTYVPAGSRTMPPPGSAATESMEDCNALSAP